MPDCLDTTTQHLHGSFQPANVNTSTPPTLHAWLVFSFLCCLQHQHPLQFATAIFLIFFCLISSFLRSISIIVLTKARTCGSSLSLVVACKHSTRPELCGTLYCRGDEYCTASPPFPTSLTSSALAASMTTGKSTST
jgi:hypothetical protein